ncbi:MAG: hypothetical protein PSV46_13865 [Reyranella sp.]|nr:hypothetical protein [Reyranella sp.]
MTKSYADIKRITTELRERDPRLGLVKGLVVIRPCGHWVRGLFLDRRTPKDVFVLSTLVQALYVPASGIRPGLGREVRAPRERGARSGVWNPFWPNCGKLLADLAVDHLLPEVEAAATPDTFPSILDMSVIPLGVTEERILTHALAGRLEEAAAMARAYLETHQGAPWARVKPSDRRRRERLIRIFESGQARTNRLLRTFERTMARRLGVEKWWEWKPFVNA